MTQQTNGMPELKVLRDVWEVMKRHGLEAKYCPHCDQFSQARVLLKQDQLISDLYEALKMLIEHLNMPKGESGRPYMADVKRATLKALAKVESKED